LLFLRGRGGVDTIALHRVDLHEFAESVAAAGRGRTSDAESGGSDAESGGVGPGGGAGVSASWPVGFNDEPEELGDGVDAPSWRRLCGGCQQRRLRSPELSYPFGEQPAERGAAVFGLCGMVGCCAPPPDPRKHASSKTAPLKRKNNKWSRQKGGARK
jgi:hypothetical protein